MQYNTSPFEGILGATEADAIQKSMQSLSVPADAAIKALQAFGCAAKSIDAELTSLLSQTKTRLYWYWLGRW